MKKKAARRAKGRQMRAHKKKPGFRKAAGYKTKMRKKSGFKKQKAPAPPRQSKPVFRRKELLSNEILRDFLLNTAGENAQRVLGEMTSAVSDEELARTCKLKVSEVRAVLNKLHVHGIADYERTRDRDTGWYYYKWYVNEREMAKLIAGEKQKRNGWARQQALEATYSFYSCSSHESEKHSFEVALDYLFKCPQCGSALNYVEGQQAQKK